MPGVEAYLRRLLQAGPTSLQPKLAEMLAGYPALHAELAAKLPSLQVPARANAVWSLGRIGARETLPLLLERIKDSDAVVAANALAAAALVAQRAQLSVTPALCAALLREETYVQANALVGLRLLGARCGNGRESSRLRHPNRVVRERAAWLLRAVPGPTAQIDAQALLRCQNTETDSGVAAACQQTSSPPPTTERDAGVTLYVTASGGGAPLAQAAFALVSNAGFIRVGWADRRGVVFDLRPSTAGATLVAP
jgi:HEAT repeat protein